MFIVVVVWSQVITLGNNLILKVEVDNLRTPFSYSGRPGFGVYLSCWMFSEFSRLLSFRQDISRTTRHAMLSFCQDISRTAHHAIFSFRQDISRTTHHAILPFPQDISRTAHHAILSFRQDISRTTHHARSWPVVFLSYAIPCILSYRPTLYCLSYWMSIRKWDW